MSKILSISSSAGYPCMLFRRNHSGSFCRFRQASVKSLPSLRGSFSMPSLSIYECIVLLCWYLIPLFNSLRFQREEEEEISLLLSY